MNWNRWFRQIHRWLSITFTVTVIIVTVAVVGQLEAVVWVSFVPLLPLALLMISGLYMFALPYVAKWRSGRSLVRQQ